MILVALAAGCGQRTIQKEDKQSPPEKRILHTAAGKTTKREEASKENKGHGRIQWEVEWQSAELDYLTEKDFGGKMTQVKGTLFERNRPASTFRADGADAYRQSNRLTMYGNVVLTSSAPEGASDRLQSTMTCDRLVWDAGEEVVKAQRNVRLNTLDYRLGPIPELWATPKMDMFATPELFTKPGTDRSNKRMDIKGLKLGVALGVAATAAGAQERNVWSFEDVGGNMKVTNVEGTKTKRLPNGDIDFLFIGRPLHASWEAQGVVIETPKMSGIAERADKGKIRLVKASMSGGVTATIERPSSSRTSPKPQTVVLTGQDAQFDAKAGKLYLTGGVRVVGDDEGAGRHVTMTGSSAVVDIGAPDTAKANRGIQSAELQGPTSFVMDSSEPARGGAVHRSHATGKGDKLTYEMVGEERKISLTGGASFTLKESEERDGVADKSKSRSIDLSGSSATVVLPVSAKSGVEDLQSAQVEGPVRFSMDSFHVEGGKPAAPVHIQGKADRLEYRTRTDSERSADDPEVRSLMTLTGNVEATSGPTGYEALQGATIQHVKKLIIGFDKDREPASIETEGVPSETILKRNPPPPKQTGKTRKKTSLRNAVGTQGAAA